MATLDRRTCARCGERDGEIFAIADMNQGENAPPLHPRCRCTIVATFDTPKSRSKPVGERSARETGDRRERAPADMTYRDWKAIYIDKSKTFDEWRANLTAPAAGGKVATDALTAPPSRGNVAVLTSPPQTVGKCKTFDELKTYWAENYNVKVDDSIAKLHFGSVQAAMNGVEAVLKEFPPAMRFLKEFSTRTEGLMTTVRGRGIINFDPKSFSDERELLATLASGVKSGFYIKNANPLSAGAHEAGHIIEDWLIDKYGGNVLDAQEIKRREQARRIVQRAFSIAKKIPEGTGKTISQLKVEISLNANDMKISECLASAVADYMTNEQNSALLSQCVWRVLKEELI